VSSNVGPHHTVLLSWRFSTSAVGWCRLMSPDARRFLHRAEQMQIGCRPIDLQPVGHRRTTPMNIDAIGALGGIPENTAGPAGRKRRRTGGIGRDSRLASPLPDT